MRPQFIVPSSRRGSWEIAHMGSAHTSEDVQVWKAAARQWLHANQESLNFGDGRPMATVLIISTRLLAKPLHPERQPPPVGLEGLRISRVVT